jgi:ATP-dependent Clp protease ATP-binding subunit ClpA
VGPTGTGKTFLAQLVSRVLFPKGQPVVIPMNQYKNAQDVITLLGSAGGGHGGSLTTPVREDSHRVILLDEIEKANSDLHHALFDVLDTGETRDKSTGQLLSFGGCLFLGTCNAGVAELRALAASAPEPAVWMGRARDVLATRAGFDKAFLARWDQIIFVDELAPVHVAEVACLQIAQYWRQHGMEVTYASPSAILATIQLNAEFREYGVRQLANLIRAQSEPAILAARDEGYTRVRLEAADGGRLHVSRGTK